MSNIAWVLLSNVIECLMKLLYFVNFMLWSIYLIFYNKKITHFQNVAEKDILWQNDALLYACAMC